MKQEYIDKFPKWCDRTYATIQNKEYKYILSDDLDSLLSCHYLMNYLGGSIQFFYDFNGYYALKDYVLNNTIIGVDADTIGVDIDFFKNHHKSWGNHVVAFNINDDLGYNRANINAIDKINLSNYFSKYSGSTLLQVLSYYNTDISNLTDNGLMTLLSIDSAYAGFYTGYEEPTKANKYYLCDILELNRLYEFQQSKRPDDFRNFKLKYGLSVSSGSKTKDNKIIIDENGLLKFEYPIDIEAINQFLNIDLKLPEGKFKLIKKFKNKSARLLPQDAEKMKREDLSRKIFTLAIIRKYPPRGGDNIKYSIRVNEG